MVGGGPTKRWRHAAGPRYVPPGKLSALKNPSKPQRSRPKRRTEAAKLTDEQRALVRPLLPPRRGGIGRAPLEHRTVLGGILWVSRTGSSWREMPEEFGEWERAYRRHELWTEQDLWQRILRRLGEEDVPGPVATEPN